MAQAILCTYYPVWVNEFAPKKSQTVWMGGLQIAAILGSAFGGIVSSVAADNKEFNLD